MTLSPEVVGIAAIILLLVLMALRVPIAYSILTVGLLGMAALRGWSAGVQSVASTLYNTFTSYSFSAIPLFILMGYLTYYSGMMETLFDAAKKWIGHFRGGLVSAGILGGTAFGAVCGAGNAASATLSRVVAPELLKAGTDRKLTFGSVCSTAILDPLIPPSILAMLLAVALEVSIGKVLIGGILPGLITAALFMIYVYIAVRRKPELAPRSEKSGWGARFRSLLKIWDFLIIVFLIIFGIYTGFFTPTEAGAVSSTAILIILAVKRKLTFKVIKDSLLDSMRTIGVAFFVVGTVFVFGSFLTLTRLPDIFVNWVIGLNAPPVVTLLCIITFFMIIGMFMDVMSVVYITIPILAPLMAALGYDPVWFAVMLLILVTVDAITPPFGASLFIMRACIEDSTLSEIYRGVIPFVFLTVITIILCIMFPQIILFLPSTM